MNSRGMCSEPAIKTQGSPSVKTDRWATRGHGLADIN